MKRLIWLLACVALTSAPTLPCRAEGTEPFWIVVYHQAKPRAAFVPRVEPYTEGGPAVSVYLMDQRDVRTNEGKVVTGFEFIGWMEGSSARVLVFALVPRDDAPNEYMPGGESGILRRRHFATYRVGLSKSVSIAEMRSLGIEPMVLKGQKERPKTQDERQLR